MKNVCIVGYGAIAKTHASALEKVDNATFSVLLHQMLVELMINLRLISHQRKREASAISPVLKASFAFRVKLPSSSKSLIS